MKQVTKVLSTGFAIFSMFFGAGNVVFPFAIGQETLGQFPFAAMGLFLTAALMPMLGLLGVLLFDGHYRPFFDRIGKYPGFAVMAICLALLGPFGATPRCIAVSYANIKPILPSLNLLSFSFISCVLIYVLSIKRSRLLDILGTYLTPILLLSLLTIIGLGAYNAPELVPVMHTEAEAFKLGFYKGYHTMDLMAGLFFSAMAVLCLRREYGDKESPQELFSIAWKSSLIATILLGVIYAGFVAVAGWYGPQLGGSPPEELIAKVSDLILGHYAGFVVTVAVTLACLTTEIALVAIFAEFLHEDVTNEKLSYSLSVLITLVLTFAISTLEFSGIAQLLSPMLQVLYPSIITLCLCNILHKLLGFKPVKVPVALTFCGSLIYYLSQSM